MKRKHNLLVLLAIILLCVYLAVIYSWFLQARTAEQRQAAYCTQFFNVPENELYRVPRECLRDYAEVHY